MKNFTFLVVLLCVQLVTFGQHQFETSDAPVVHVKNQSLDHFRYIDYHPELMCGTYFTSGTSERFGQTNNYEISVKLSEDGSCETMYYNSGLVGNVPKRKITAGSWGLAADKDGKPIIANENGEYWYRIIIVSDDPNQKLAYYDRTAYYDWINIDEAEQVFLRFVFSSNPKVAKQVQ